MYKGVSWQVRGGSGRMCIGGGWAVEGSWAVGGGWAVGGRLYLPIRLFRASMSPRSAIHRAAQAYGGPT